MKISTECPPIYKILHDAFGAEWEDHIMITVGDTVHTVDPGYIREDLLVHEKCHEVQQRVEGPAIWWKKYVDDPQFRLNEEILAYKTQAIYLRQTFKKDRERLAKFYHSMATDLSSSMYGNIVTFPQALKIVRK